MSRTESAETQTAKGRPVARHRRLRLLVDEAHPCQPAIYAQGSRWPATPDIGTCQVTTSLFRCFA